ncbi:zinc finger CCCH domain-containing protein 6-like [Neltuma alba]|uniref:zinc finger CCCH domain-containing protein 6-like n=1 Tax=Neltuma alba TaxID=207710 RepID=UPI0010A586D2|nr:zinc finger CCCH domain-containing protein 6-like [Prosopis alba]
MKRAWKSSNRVSWAPGGNLCQVKLFISEDCPSKVGQKSQDRLQAKVSSILHSSIIEFNDLPPRFECNPLPNQSKYEHSCIPQINWRCPPPFVFSYNWHVVAGEESREKEDQKLRDLRVLEAVYPRHSAIPPSPSVALDVEEEDYDDNTTPLVPIIPIEEEESMYDKPELAAGRDAPTTVQSQNLHQYMSAITAPIQSNTSSSLALTVCGNPSPGISSGSEVDLVAASAVVGAVMKSSEQRSLIDMDLLVKIFNDPLMIEKLVSDHRTAATTARTSSNTVAIPPSGLKLAAPSLPPSTLTLGEPTYGVTPAITVGLLSSRLKPEIPPVLSSTSMPDKLAIPSIPMSMPGKPAIPSVPLQAPTLDMRMPVNQSCHHMSNGVLQTLDTQPPQQDDLLVTGAMHAASLASMPTISLGGNLQHSVTCQVRSTAGTMLHQASAGPAFAAKEAHSVKDANYLKNLIRQHGSDKQDVQDSQIGIRHSNFQNIKSVHNNKPEEVEYKIQKTCIYFNSSRGCRNGSSCPYRHDMSIRWEADNALGGQNSKRLKLEPEIKGRI